MENNEDIETMNCKICKDGKIIFEGDFPYFLWGILSEYIMIIDGDEFFYTGNKQITFTISAPKYFEQFSKLKEITVEEHNKYMSFYSVLPT